MKKRIIGLILIVAMLTLSLVGCGYSYAEDDLSYCATFDKAAFEKALMEIEIDDGDYTIDGETRAKKVLNTIYTALAAEADTDAKIKEGVIGNFDKLFYCYYATVTKDGTTHTVFATNMNESSAVSVQLGIGAEGISEDVEAALKGQDITGKAYTTLTSGAAAAGKTAFVSYKCSYNETAEDGTSVKREKTVTNQMIVIGEEGNELAAKFVDKSIGSDIEDFIIGEGDAAKTYSDAKINWVVDGGEAFSFKDVTYDEAKTVKDVFGDDVDLKGCELEYFVYPVYFLKVEELSATAVIKTLLSELVTDVTDHEGHDHAEDEGADEVEFALPSLKTQKAIAEALDELKTKFDSADSALTSAQKSKDDAQKKYDEAVTKGGETPTADQQTAIDNAKKTLDDANIKLAEKQTEFDTASTGLDAKMAELFAVISEDTIKAEYEEKVHNDLLDKYNDEIKNNVAKAVWALMQKHTKVTKENMPREAIQKQYDNLIEAYEYDFYEGTTTASDGSSSVSNYKQYGTFRKYLMSVTKADTYENAKHAVWAEAMETVEDAVIVYSVAAGLGLKYTDEDVKEYKEDLSSNYSYYEHYYGEENVLLAFQFDIIMNHYVDFEEYENGEIMKSVEKSGENVFVTDIDGYFITSNKKFIKFKFGGEGAN